MGRLLSKNKYGTYMDGFHAIGDYFEAVSLPVTSGVAIAKGDLIITTSGYMSLATTLASASKSCWYVAVSENTAAEASANGAVDVQCIPIANPNVRYQVPVTDQVLVQATHVGNIYNVDGSEDGITLAAAVTVDWGFLIEEIDISDAAIAINTYGYAIGRFAQFSETT